MVRMPPSGFFSSITAAALMGLPLPHSLMAGASLHVAVPAPTRGLKAAGIVGHKVRLMGGDVRQWHGLPVSSPERAYCEIAAALSIGDLVAVGCQSGADQAVVLAVVAAGLAARLRVFCVAASLPACPAWVQAAARAGAAVVLAAGGPASVPLVARYLLRSVAAFAGCSRAVFAAPGAGSLAVARECVRASVPGAWVPGPGGWSSWVPAQSRLF